LKTYCRRCVTPSTRPRVKFDADGICNACKWHERKLGIKWKWRKLDLERILSRFRGKGQWDMIVPLSGGKDSSMIAHRMKYEFGMNPLTVSFANPLPTRIGLENLHNAVQTGFDNITITPDTTQYRLFAKRLFLDAGLPKQPFVVGISTAIIKIAKAFGIKLIMFAEQGEREYGGDADSVHKFNRDFLTKIYYEGQDDCGKYGPWWEIPTDADLEDLHVTWMAEFIPWDPEANARYAKDNCGMQMLVGGNIGTFSNYAQNEDKLQDLHTFLMFLKHGMGRCTSDASIEVRFGRMSREEGVKVVNMLDGQFPVEHLPAYLDYFEMKSYEFWATCAKLVSNDLLVETDDIARPWVLRTPCV